MAPAALVLAGGASSRMPGASKLARAWGDTTVLGAVIRAARAAELGPVAGAGSTSVSSTGRAAADRWLQAPAGGGRADSLATGLSELPPGPVVVLLGDEPGVEPEIVRALVELCEASGVDAGRVRYADRAGHPVWMGQAARDVAAGLTGEAAVWEALSRPPLRTALLTRVEAAPIDVDSPRDLERARRRGRA